MTPTLASLIFTLAPIIAIYLAATQTALLLSAFRGAEMGLGDCFMLAYDVIYVAIWSLLDGLVLLALGDLVLSVLTVRSRPDSSNQVAPPDWLLNLPGGVYRNLGRWLGMIGVILAALAIAQAGFIVTTNVSRVNPMSPNVHISLGFLNQWYTAPVLSALKGVVRGLAYVGLGEIVVLLRKAAGQKRLSARRDDAPVERMSQA